MADLKRHHRSLIWNADSGLLLWEVARKTPEGYTCGICKTEKGKQILEQYSRTLGDLDRPKLLVRPEKAQKDYLSYDDFYNLILSLQYSGTIFDRLFFVDPFVNEKSIKELSTSIKNIYENKIEKDEDLDDEMKIECPFSKDFSIILSQKIPAEGQKISKLVKEQILNEQTLPSFAKTISQMENAEKEFFADKENALFNWNEKTIVSAFQKNGFTVECAEQIITEKRRISKTEIEKWFNPQTSAYGNKLFSCIEKNDLQKIINLLEVSSEKSIFNWQSKTVFIKIKYLQKS
jgi:putative ATPase